MPRDKSLSILSNLPYKRNVNSEKLFTDFR